MEGRTRSGDAPSNGGFGRGVPAGWSIPVGRALRQPLAHQLCVMETPMLHPQPKLANNDLLILHFVLNAAFL